MKTTDVYIETVLDLPSANSNIHRIFMENIVDLKDEKKLKVKTVFIETVEEFAMSQSV